MRPILIGLGMALLVAVGFSLLSSVFICLGIDPESRWVADAACPVLGLVVGGYFASRRGSWRTGGFVALAFVLIWIGFWFYTMGRGNLVWWVEEGLPRLTFADGAWWVLAIGVGICGGGLPRLSRLQFGGMIALFGVALFAGMFAAQPGAIPDTETVSGFHVERMSAAPDGTTGYILAIDARKQSDLAVGIYDCDEDDAVPFDDANASYLGQSLRGLTTKLAGRAEGRHGQLLCVINGGFFGASGAAVAHHEEPIVQEGQPHYDHIDLLRPKEQAWFFAVNSAARASEGRPRYALLPDIPPNELHDYRTVLGGVRPLRVDGTSVELKPGAGATTLRCSRTSLGWSADGNVLTILIVNDPDGELSSQLQRKWNFPQTGGWDVREVQKFWEDRQVPNAVLFDGGESTQLAFRALGGGYRYLDSGYRYSFTLGYLFQRPLRFTLPILPPQTGHRGVLNYLYVEGRE